MTEVICKHCQEAFEITCIQKFDTHYACAECIDENDIRNIEEEE